MQCLHMWIGLVPKKSKHLNPIENLWKKLKLRVFLEDHRIFVGKNGPKSHLSNATGVYIQEVSWSFNHKT